MVERRCEVPSVTGSNPVPAKRNNMKRIFTLFGLIILSIISCVKQSDEDLASRRSFTEKIPARLKLTEYGIYLKVYCYRNKEYLLVYHPGIGIVDMENTGNECEKK